MKKKNKENLKTENNLNNVENNTNVVKRTFFSLKDSSINFIFSLVIPVLAAVVMAALFAFFATFSGSSYEAFIKTELATIITLLYTQAVFLLIYFLYTKRMKINYKVASDINPKLNWQKVLVVITIALVSVFLIAPFISLLDHAYSLMGYNPNNGLSYVMDNGFRYVIGIIVMAVVPAFCEELLFRGLILKGLTHKFNPHAAIVISAIMFTLLHGSLQQTVYQFILGLLLGYAMYYGKSIFYPMVLHFVNNLVVVTMSFAYTLNNVDVNAPTVYSSVMDYLLPIILFIVAIGIIVGLIFLLKYFNNRILEKNNENSNNLESKKKVSNIIEVNNKNIQNSENVPPQIKAEKFKLTRNEMLFFFGGIVLGIVIWIINTISVF